MLPTTVATERASGAPGGSLPAATATAVDAAVAVVEALSVPVAVALLLAFFLLIWLREE